MRYKIEIQQISLSGLLIALAIIFSFLNFPLFGGKVYLVGISIFLMPLILKFHYSIISAIISVVIADALSGWIAFTWISIIAYGFAILIISYFKKIKIQLIFILGLILGSLFATLCYFLFEFIVFDKSIAIMDVFATLIEFSIVVPIVSLLYLPINLKIK